MRRALVVAVAAALVACSSEPTFTGAELPQLVLGEADAPAGTELVDGSSGEQPLDRYAEDDAERDALREAGFETAYLNLFLGRNMFEGGDLTKVRPGGSLAVSFAVLFATRDGAVRGLSIIEDDVRTDGADLESRPTDGFPRDSFGYHGTFDRSFAPGYIFAWRRGNAVFGLATAGAPDTISESATRALAERMLRRTG